MPTRHKLGTSSPFLAPRGPVLGRTRVGSAGLAHLSGMETTTATLDTVLSLSELAARLGVPVIPAYASAATPTVETAVRTLLARGRRHIALASYFTAPGRFATECAQQAPWIAAAPLGTHPTMADLVLHRYEEALATAAEPALASA